MTEGGTQGIDALFLKRSCPTGVPRRTRVGEAYEG
jgi:hypothetical protein